MKNFGTFFLFKKKIGLRGRGKKNSDLIPKAILKIAQWKHYYLNYFIILCVFGSCNCWKRQAKRTRNLSHQIFCPPPSLPAGFCFSSFVGHFDFFTNMNFFCKENIHNLRENERMIWQVHFSLSEKKKFLLKGFSIFPGLMVYTDRIKEAITLRIYHGLFFFSFPGNRVRGRKKN